MSWHGHLRCCNECGTDRRKFRARGMCTFCYRVHTRIRQARKWDNARPETLIGVQTEWVPRERAEFETYRTSVVRQLEQMLLQAREREACRRGTVDGLTIEYQLRRLARRAGARNRTLHFGIAGYVEMSFGARQRRALFGLLADIEESYEKVEIRWPKVWAAVERRRSL